MIFMSSIGGILGLGALCSPNNLGVYLSSSLKHLHMHLGEYPYEGMDYCGDLCPPITSNEV
jgi:hypothetical protein